jgi:hypothetical protein
MPTRRRPDDNRRASSLLGGWPRPAALQLSRTATTAGTEPAESRHKSFAARGE